MWRRNSYYKDYEDQFQLLSLYTHLELVQFNLGELLCAQRTRTVTIEITPSWQDHTTHHHIHIHWLLPAAANGPARRAASRASCCTQRWTLSVINCVAMYCQLTDDSRQFIILNVHHCRTKLTTRCDDRRAVAKLSKFDAWDKVPEGSSSRGKFPYFWRYSRLRMLTADKSGQAQLLHPSKCPFPGESGTPPNTYLLGLPKPTIQTTPRSVWPFLQGSWWTDTQRDSPTDHVTCVTIAYIFFYHKMWWTINQSCIFRGVQVIKSLQDPLNSDSSFHRLLSLNRGTNITSKLRHAKDFKLIRSRKEKIRNSFIPYILTTY